MANIVFHSEELSQSHLQGLPGWPQAEEELALPLPTMQTLTKFPCFSKPQVLPSVEPPTKEVGLRSESLETSTYSPSDNFEARV